MASDVPEHDCEDHWQPLDTTEGGQDIDVRECQICAARAQYDTLLDEYVVEF